MEHRDETDALMRASVFGRFVIENGSGDPIEISNRRGRTILAMLCLNPGQSLSRDLVSKLIWAGRFKPQARASLRQCLHDLNRELESANLDILDVSNAHLALKPGAVATDLNDLEQALLHSNVTDATQKLGQLTGKTLLPEIDLGDALKDWLTAQRKQVENRLRVATQRRLSDLLTHADKAAYEALNTTWKAWTGVSRLRTRSELAILPFKQVDELGGTFFLADGVVEELSSRLAGNESIALAGRSSIEAISDSGLTLAEIGEKLSVTHLIEGSVHRTAASVTLSVRLIEPASGKQIWSNRIDHPEAHFFDQRKAMGETLVSDLCRAMGVAERTAPVRRMTKNREAYALYLQGRALIQRMMVEGALTKAIDLLQQALDLDPGFSECWTALAEAYIHSTVYIPCLDRVPRSEKAAACASEALRLDPGQGYAHAILSIHEWTCFNPAKALEYAMEAYRLEPNNADVTLRLGSCLLYLGRSREALPYIEAAIEQDPVYGRNYAMLCVVHLNLGDIEAALAAGHRMVDLGYPGFHLAVAQAAAGQNDAAVETYYDTRRYLGTVIMSPPGSAEISDEARDFYLMTAAKGICSGDPGDRSTYCNLIDMLHQTLPEPYDPSVALPAVFMGHADLTMKIFREQIHPANMPALMSLWADIEPLRQTRAHPDFMAFAEDIGMVEAWEKYGWPDLIPSDPR